MRRFVEESPGVFVFDGEGYRARYVVPTPVIRAMVVPRWRILLGMLLLR